MKKTKPFATFYRIRIRHKQIDSINQKITDMKKFINKFQSLKGAQFISINNYLSSTSGEIANHIINVNISVMNAKQSDLQTLLNCTDNDLKKVSRLTSIAVDVLKLSLAEMQESAEKNVSVNAEDRTAQSQAQTDAYFHITPAIRLHKDTLTVHVFGQAIKKDVVVEGIYKTVNSSPKTLGKKAITKYFDLKASKFRDFILGNADTLKVAGTTIEIVR